jgi:hypothetical protein
MLLSVKLGWNCSIVDHARVVDAKRLIMSRLGILSALTYFASCTLRAPLAASCTQCDESFPLQLHVPRQIKRQRAVNVHRHEFA